MPPQPIHTREERISREMMWLQKWNYEGKLHMDRENNLLYVQVQLQRKTEKEGPQPVHVYLLLDSDFPQSRPDLIVTLDSPIYTDSAEINELQIAIESKKRQTWTNDSGLYMIVEEIERAIQNDDLELASQLFERPAVFESVAEPSGTPAASAGANRLLWSLRRRLISARPLLSGALAAVLVLGFVFMAYYAFWYDPCAASAQVAEDDLRAGDSTALEHAIGLLEDLRQRGINGTRGRCAALVNGPDPLYDAYLHSGENWQRTGNLQQAEERYRSALDLAAAFQNPRPRQDNAQRHLDVVRMLPHWMKVQKLQQQEVSTASLEQVIDALVQIHSINADAINPSGEISVTRSLYQAHINLGDQHYKDLRFDDAEREYQTAQELCVTNLNLCASKANAKKRAIWAGFQKRLLTIATDDQWQALLNDLQNAEKLPQEPNDPAGQTIDDLRYKAYVGYAQILLKLGGTRILEVLQRTNAALNLETEIDKTDARTLLAQAKAQLAANNVYSLERQELDAATWSAELKHRKLPTKELNNAPTNLIIIRPTSGITLTLVSASLLRPDILEDGDFNSDGEASRAITDRYAILKLTNGAQTDEIYLDFTKAQTYRVRVVGRQQK